MPMPRFFFNVRDSGGRIEDPDGTEFPDLEAARVEALTSARSLLAEQIKRRGTLGDQQFEICDEAGKLLLEVPFRDAIGAP